MRQAVILVVGHNVSGKTFLSKQLAKDLAIERVNGDDFRLFTIEHTDYFKDIDRSSSNNKMEQLSALTINYRFTMMNTLLDAGCSILFDGSGATAEWRARIFDTANPVARQLLSIIVAIEAPEPTLLARLQERDDNEGNTHWIEHYHSLKKNLYESPKPSEADYLLTYIQNNYDQIHMQLREILSISSEESPS